MKLIEYALIDGERYKINSDFKIALKCDEVLNDRTLNDTERGIKITGLLFGKDSPYNDEALRKARIFLSGGDDKEGNDEKRVIDFNQHYNLVYSAFISQYGIDLNKDNLHYQEFLMLLQGLKGQVLNDVVEILTYDLSEVKDHKQKRKIIEAQKQFKIKEPKQEVKEHAFLQGLNNKVRGE